MSSPPNANYGPETCAWCKGTGEDRRKDHRGEFRCVSCAGQGAVMVALPSAPCPKCSGAGNLVTGEFELCVECYGSGWRLRWIAPRTD